MTNIEYACYEAMNIKKYILAIFPSAPYSESEEYTKAMVAQYSSGNTSLQHRAFTTQKQLDEIKAKACKLKIS